MSIRRKIFLVLFGLTTLPILALGVILTWQSYKAQQRDTTSRQKQVALQVAVQSRDILELDEKQALLLIYNNDLFALNRNEQQVLLAGFMSFTGNIEEATLINHAGQEIIRISKSQIVTDSDLQSRTTDLQFTIPAQSHITYFSSISVSDATNEPLVIISVPIINRRSGIFEGVLVMNTQMKIIWDLIEQKSRELDQEIFIITTDGQIIAHPNRSIVLRGTTYTPDAEKAIVRGLDGDLSTMGSETFQIGNQQFTVIAMEPLTKEYQHLISSVLAILGIVLLTSLVIVYLAMRLGSYISRPINILAESAEAMAAGKLDHRADVNSNDEIGLLASTFNSMADKIKLNITTLTALQDSTSAIINELDMNRVLEAIMRQVTELLGVEHSFIFMVEPDESSLRLHLGTGINIQHIGKKLIRGEGLSGKIWDTGKLLSVDYYGSWDGRSKQFNSTPFHSVAGAPLVSKGRVLGVLGINYTDPERTISAEGLELLAKFASLASVALGNAQLYKIAQDEILERKKAEDRAIQQLDRLNSLRTIDLSITSSSNINITLKTIIKETLTHVNADAASIMLFNPVMNTFEIGAAIGFKFNPPKNIIPRAQAGLASLASQQQNTLYIFDLTDNALYLTGFVDDQEEFISYYGVPLFIKGELKGVLEIYHRTSLKLNAENQEFLETLATQTAIAIDNHSMFHNLQQTNKNLQIAYETTLEGWSAALDLRDKETEGHTLRVTELTLKLAQSMGVRENELLHIRRGALLHDIGKMGVPDRILQKPGELTYEERQIIEQHPINAYNLLSPIPYLQPALDIPYCHHEKWDGTGYPRKLKGNKIPFAARLFAIVDVYDALRSNRPYRDGWEKQKTLDYIKRESGSHFDPKVVAAFISMIIDE